MLKTIEISDSIWFSRAILKKVYKKSTSSSNPVPKSWVPHFLHCLKVLSPLPIQPNKLYTGIEITDTKEPDDQNTGFSAPAG